MATARRRADVKEQLNAVGAEPATMSAAEFQQVHPGRDRTSGASRSSSLRAKWTVAVMDAIADLFPPRHLSPPASAWTTCPRKSASRAKHLILDALGIAIACTQWDFARVTLAGLRELAGPGGDVPVIGHGESLPLRDAVAMNALLVHGLDYDDTHPAGVIHATTSVPAGGAGPGHRALAARAATCWRPTSWAWRRPTRLGRRPPKVDSTRSASIPRA
jgi:hypothetical protein